MKIGEKIKRLRKLRNMTQIELGKRIGGAGKHQISFYESGKTVPSTETLIKVANALGTTVDYLVNDKIKEDDIKYTPLINDKELLRIFEKVDQLPTKEKNLIKELSTALIFRNDIKIKVK